MVSIAFYGGIPGGVQTPIVQQSEPESKGSEKRDYEIFQPYCYDSSYKTKMAEGRDSRYQEEMIPKEESKGKEEKGRNDWWKIGMFMLCLLGAAGGILWWYEGAPDVHYIGLVAVGGRLNGSGMTNAIECWGTFPGCRPFTNYFSYKTNRSIHADNNTATLLNAYHREVTYIYKTSCVDSDHCQEYVCQNISMTNKGSTLTINITGDGTDYWGFQWLECNQTENAKTMVVPINEMVQIDNSSWVPKGCNETWARVKQCPVDLLYGIHPIRLCVQPPFFLVKNDSSNDNSSNSTLSNCGPSIFLGILEDNKAVVTKGNCTLHKKNINRPLYYGQYIVPIFYKCNFSYTSCDNDPLISVIMYEPDNVQYLLCNINGTNNTSNNTRNINNASCIVQTFGTIGQAHLELPRKNKRIATPNFSHYNCTVNNKTEMQEWQLVKTSGITPIPISSRNEEGLIRHKRDFGLSAIVAAIVAATAIAASTTMSYIALTEASKIQDVVNHTLNVENNTLSATEMIERQINILYAMILQTHADVQLLKEKQQVEETFNLIGCIERTHTFCHTGHPWNNSWGLLNDSTQWDTWVGEMEKYNQDILTTLHVARNNLEQAMITFNTPDSIAQFGKNIWDHIANWIPGLGASIIKYIVLFLIIYVVLTSMPKLLRHLLTTMTGAGSSASRYLKRKLHHKRASQDGNWDRDQYRVHLASVNDGSEGKFNRQRAFKNSWSGESEEYSSRRKHYEKSTKEFGKSFNGLANYEEITPAFIAPNVKKDAGEKNPSQGSLSLEIQSEGGNIYDCCIKAQEGTLAIPCCGFPLWLFWGLIIILGRLIGYGLRGLAKIIMFSGRVILLSINWLRKGLDYVGKMLNPSKSHVTMPCYDI
uniref:Envelope glycoprotein n=4 Tax=Equine infectious anemia virus TaxID=11665 RepID=K7WBN5_9RETR|nr:envelope polyprotein [Equine infectious anemia virus]